ncbi:AAA family ATPase [Lactiplantibacillus fabifermentans]|uniref:Stage V sporulation protein K n=2 Tax=Lactiplantibacillus fabifermentans TaxID=483011 RepID=A0A0R2NV25_9LACO|nr:AAA family ATPase [Lactiplantibacillus fabifermentans]ETY74840.1 cbxX/cfqX [Lactiplantibacillus fabifermentans T30PCM01]KRO28427.1 stage V sporulation protein K [Lactiplantibacillus fabifermentans DSM 21115]
MTKTYHVGPGQLSLADAIAKAMAAQADSDEMPFLKLAPGYYSLTDMDYVFVENLTMQGTGSELTDVTLDMAIKVAAGGHLNLENLAITNLHATSAIVGGYQSVVNLKDVWVANEQSDQPSVWLQGTIGTITDSFIMHDYHHGTGLSATAGTQMSLNQSSIQNLMVTGQTSLDYDTVVLNQATIVDDDSSLCGENCVFTDVNADLPTLFVGHEGLFTADYVMFKNTKSIVRVDGGQVIVVGTNLDDDHRVDVVKAADEDVTLPNAQTKGAPITPVQQPVTPPVTPASDDRVDADWLATLQAQLADSAAPTAPKPVVTTAPNQPVTDKAALAELDGMIGLTGLKASVKKFINLTKFNQQRVQSGLNAVSSTYHSLYLGNPGTGKTTVARLVGQIMYQQGILSAPTFVEVSRQDLVAQYVGGTATKTETVLKKALGGVLFIDEAYSLYEAGDSTNWGQEALDTILKFMEDHRQDLMIIFAGYPKQMQNMLNMNPGLVSRIPNVFNFEDYAPAEIAQIGVQQLKTNQFNFDADYYTENVAKLYTHAADHSNGRWIRNFNDQLLQVVADDFANAPADFDMTQITNQQIDQLIGQDAPTQAQDLTQLLTALDQLVGLTTVKQFVHDLVARCQLQQRLAGQLPDMRGQSYHMVFTGNPGTGKTTVARLISQIFYNLGLLSKATVVEATRADLVGNFVGQTEEKTQTVLQQAHGGVLFIDEAYQLTSTGTTDYGQQVLETLLPALENDRDNLIVIFAGYGAPMNDFLAANPGLRSRIPYVIDFADYTPADVADIVAQRLASDWQFDAAYLRGQVMSAYASLPAEAQANGRWARNYAEQLVNRHENWLAAHPEAENVRMITNATILASFENK